MKNSKRGNCESSVGKNFLDEERNILAEERTLLAYIRTELGFFAAAILILKFYFDEGPWSLPIVIVLIIIGVIMVMRESLKIKKLRKKRNRTLREER